MLGKGRGCFDPYFAIRFEFERKTAFISKIFAVNFLKPLDICTMVPYNLGYLEE